MREIRNEDRFDEARLPEPKIPILDSLSPPEEVGSNDHARKGGCHPCHAPGSKNYREDVEMS